MNEIINAGAAIEQLSATGIIACGLVLSLLLNYKQFKMREECQKKLLKAVQGKEIDG